VTSCVCTEGTSPLKILGDIDAGERLTNDVAASQFLESGPLTPCRKSLVLSISVPVPVSRSSSALLQICFLLLATFGIEGHLRIGWEQFSLSAPQTTLPQCVSPHHRNKCDIPDYCVARDIGPQHSALRELPCCCRSFRRSALPLSSVRKPRFSSCSLTPPEGGSGNAKCQKLAARPPIDVGLRDTDGRGPISVRVGYGHGVLVEDYLIRVAIPKKSKHNTGIIFHLHRRRARHGTGTSCRFRRREFAEVRHLRRWRTRGR